MQTLTLSPVPEQKGCAYHLTPCALRRAQTQHGVIGLREFSKKRFSGTRIPRTPVHAAAPCALKVTAILDPSWQQHTRYNHVAAPKWDPLPSEKHGSTEEKKERCDSGTVTFTTQEEEGRRSLQIKYCSRIFRLGSPHRHSKRAEPAQA